ncbi:MAG: putative endonuclease [Candidatus Dependentiae bacterium]|nr:putative endonuclease [Candidatus Dependentiae bacterium]
MCYVYILRSISFPTQIYIGYTTNIEVRLIVHNAGKSPFTAKNRPWILIWHSAFLQESKAIEFEKHLKSGSSRAFAKHGFVLRS